MASLIDAVFALSPDVRYVATYNHGSLSMRSTAAANASFPESDTYEELLVNPTLLLLTQQRGEIDCGGMQYLIVRYGSFFQVVLPTEAGHLSVAVEPDGDPVALAMRIRQFLLERSSD